MLSNLKEKNKELKEKLGKLRNDSTKSYSDSQKYVSPARTEGKQRQYDSPEPAARRVAAEIDAPCRGAGQGSDHYQPSPSTKPRPTNAAETAPTQSRLNMVPSGSSGPKMMLCDRAKMIRGETSKRIEGLLNEWRDFKEERDEELRRRLRKEQDLHEVIFHKQRELEEQAQELNSLRTLSMEQKHIISKLTERVDAEDRSRTRVSQMEMQMSTCKRRITELEYELQNTDDSLRSCQHERDVLMQQNGVLRQTNLELKNRIESSEQDVTETQLELEILEEMVRALNEKKISMVSNSKRNSPLPSQLQSSRPSCSTPLKSPIPIYADQAGPSGIYNTQESSVPVNCSDVICACHEQLSPPREKFWGVFNHTAKSYTPHTTRSIEDKFNTGQPRDGALEALREPQKQSSVMTELKQLQKDHLDRCATLAEKIDKLKTSNKNKDELISCFTRIQNEK